MELTHLRKQSERKTAIDHRRDIQGAFGNYFYYKQLMYHRDSHKGQIEIITTPFYHPILPLIYDSDLMKTCQPNDPAPKRFHYPQDADAQIAKAVGFYTEQFGAKPSGMWPVKVGSK